VVDDTGMIVPVSKLSIKELRAEVEARDVVGGEDMKKAELTAVVKVRACRTGPCVLLLLPSHDAHVMPSAAATGQHNWSSSVML